MTLLSWVWMTLRNWQAKIDSCRKLSDDIVHCPYQASLHSYQKKKSLHNVSYFIPCILSQSRYIFQLKQFSVPRFIWQLNRLCKTRKKLPYNAWWRLHFQRRFIWSGVNDFCPLAPSVRWQINDCIRFFFQAHFLPYGPNVTRHIVVTNLAWMTKEFAARITRKWAL